MPLKLRDSVFDDDNPEWTEGDFASAHPAHELTTEILEQFPKTAQRLRGPQKAPKKEQIAIRLSRDIVDHYRATGRGWHSRVEAVLRKAAGL